MLQLSCSEVTEAPSGELLQEAYFEPQVGLLPSLGFPLCPGHHFMELPFTVMEEMVAGAGLKLWTVESKSWLDGGTHLGHALGQVTSNY